MKKTMTIRYILFGVLFALVIAGLVSHSYPVLIGCVVAAVILGVIGDKIESAPTEPFRKYNEKHHRHHHHTKA
ncbi:hypothetical protein JI721_01235 [Alicyclobacillus cycloheptanicus]|uniref:CDP-diglyceride synthetase n=1 Tax=Alicyclobacillus cycloheptanicus TaxID=1457 RepID=A0ABT9XLP1_9BACL|nr:hypothetical protein [Alicyclobacillus cycloheptanicus]MDQ0191228.1 CDP-diglyceride synthetase [Alicyclobacillus cycloheptanicus]WDM01534.1 hypothetical protein JI721_01235 [Alicyclobacillus cycloheptanicus]